MIDTEANTTITTIEEFIAQIKQWYANDATFKAGFNQAIAGVQTMPSETSPSVKHDWKNKTIADLCDFFNQWYVWNPEVETGLEYIQRFSWLYYENPKGLEFVTTGTGLQMTFLFVEVNAGKMNSAVSIPLVKTWQDALGKTVMDEYVIPTGGYTSFNEFFSRELKVPRPVSNPSDDSVVVSSADAIVNMIDDNLSITTPIDVKTQQLNVLELLANSDLAVKFEGGSAVSCILMPNVYHRYHSPVAGKVVESNQDVAGEYFGIKDFPKLINGGNVGYGYDYSVFEHFRRGYAIIETEEYGLVAMIPVGLNTISSVIFNDPFQDIKLTDTPVAIAKGEEIGYFQYGGSMNILLFENGVFPSVRIPQGQIIGTMAPKNPFVGTWKDLNGTIITVALSSTHPGSLAVNYGNGRGPFIGISDSTITPPAIEVNFTDDDGIKTGVTAEYGFEINWNNGTKWVRQ